MKILVHTDEIGVYNQSPLSARRSTRTLLPTDPRTHRLIQVFTRCTSLRRLCRAPTQFYVHVVLNCKDIFVEPMPYHCHSVQTCWPHSWLESELIWLEFNLVFKYDNDLFCSEPEDFYTNKNVVNPFEPLRYKTNKMECAPSEDSDQPGHSPSLIRVLAVRMKKAWVLI